MISLRIVTPDNEVIELYGLVTVSFATVKGRITIMNNHLPLIGELVPCKVVAKKQNGKRVFALNEGFVRVEDNQVTIVTSKIEEVDL